MNFPRIFRASRNLQGFALCAQGPSKFIHFVFSLWGHLLRILLIKTLLFKVTCDFRSGPFVAHLRCGKIWVIKCFIQSYLRHKDLYKKGVRRPFLSISCVYTLQTSGVWYPRVCVFVNMENMFAKIEIQELVGVCF